jgi:nucleoside-diphosphate-sugar epimerase
MVQRILVTGAQGFIGSAIANHLHALPDYEVIGTVRTPGHGTAPYPVHAMPLRAETDWKNPLHHIDTIIHTAARVHQMNDDSADPMADYRAVNVTATQNLAKQAAEAGARRLIFLSSVKVNGEASPPDAPFTEETPPAPSDPYGLSKWEAEQALHEVAKHTGLEVVIVRLPLVYGPGVRANFATMLRWVQQGRPLPLGCVTGNRRSIVAVENVIDFLTTCIHHPHAANECFYIRDPEDVSTRQLIERTAEAFGKPARLLPVPMPLLTLAGTLTGKQAMIQRLTGNLQISRQKAHQLLGWSPPVGTLAALKKMALA